MSNNDLKTCDWLTAQELSGKYIVGNAAKIRTLMSEHEAQSYIQKKRQGTNWALCLHRDYVGDFCRLTGLLRAENFPAKTKDWVLAHDLAAQYVVGGTAKVLGALVKCKDKMPGCIQYVRSGKRVALCLRNDALDEFCKLSGLARKDVVKDEEVEFIPYHVPEIIKSMPPLLCSIFGRESR